MNDDIIVAVATSRLEAAISIIRLSGKDVIAFVQQFFTGKIINKESHTITYGYIKDNGEKIDEVLVNIYRGKRTFTGEEMVENEREKQKELLLYKEKKLYFNDCIKLIDNQNIDAAKMNHFLKSFISKIEYYDNSYNDMNKYNLKIYLKI